MKLVGFDLQEIDAGRTYGELVITQDHLQQTGLIHGGVTATVADIVCGFAAYTTVPDTHHVVTAELRISYLRPGKGSVIAAEGRVLKSGEKLIFCESDVWAIDQGQRTLIAKASAIMATIQPASSQ